MAGNKRVGREISPRDAQEHKKLKKITGDSSSKQSQQLRQNGSSTLDLASGNSAESRSSASASGSRPTSPVKRRSSKTMSAGSSSRPPLRISTPTQAANGLSKASAGPASAKEPSPSASELMSRPRPKRASTPSATLSETFPEDQGDASQPPRRGNAPTAPMMGLSAAAVPTSTRAATALTPSTATEAGTLTGPLTNTRGRTLYDVLSDTAKLTGQSIQQVLTKESAKERLERYLEQASSKGSAADYGARISAQQQKLKDVETDAEDVDERLQAQYRALESSIQWEIDKCVSQNVDKVTKRDGALERQVQNLERNLRNLEKRQGARDSRLRGALSPLQVPESAHGILPHDELEQMIERLVKNQLAARFKGPLASAASLPMPDEGSVVVANTPREIAPNAQAEPQSEIAQMKRDLEVFKQQMCAKDKERDTKMQKLEQEYSQFQSQITQLGDTTQKANAETSSLGDSITALKQAKADQGELSPLKEAVKTSSKEFKDVASVTRAVIKLQTATKTIRDDLNRFKSDTGPSKDQGQSIVTPAPSNMNSQFNDLLQRVKTLERSVGNLPTGSRASNLQEDSDKFKDVLEQLESQAEHIQRSARDLETDNTRINEINRDIEDLGDTLGGLERKVEGELKARLAEIKKLQDKMAEYEQEIKSLDSKITQAVGKHTSDGNKTIKAGLDDLEARQAAQQDSIITTARSVEALEKKVIDTKQTHENALVNLERKTNERLAALAKSFDEIQKRLDTIEQGHSSLQSKVDGIDAKLAAADAERLQRDEVQKRFDAMEKEQSSMHGKIDEMDSRLKSANTEAIQRHVNVIEKGQSSLHGKIGDIDVRLKTAEQANRSSLESSDKHAESIRRLERVLGGAGSANLDTTASRGPGLIQQLANIKNATQSTKRATRSNSTSNPTPARETDTTRPDSAPGLVALESRVAQIEEYCAKLRESTENLKVDFTEIDDLVNTQSALIEADVGTRVGDQVKTALATVDQRMEHFTSKLNEVRDLCQNTASQPPAAPNVREIQESVFSRLEPFASRMVNEKFDGANERFDGIQTSLLALSNAVTRLERLNPPNFQEAMTDIVAFHGTHGKISNFLQAMSEALRNLQGRYDNMLTQQLALHILNQLAPQINKQLIGPIRDAITPVLSNEFRHNFKQFSDKQELLDTKMGELERRVNPASDNALRELRQETLRLCASINERIDKDARLTNEAIQNLRIYNEATKADFDTDKDIIWQHIKEHRDNIERAQDDFGAIQGCVIRIAKEVNINLVPHDWHDLG